jgi:Ser/Thr protein kinase RdoA (MazF antagonist)
VTEREPVPRADLAGVLDALGLHARGIAVLKDVPGENGSWLVELAERERAGAQPIVLRRYHDRATLADLAYEHSVLHYLAGAGWVVPEPVGEVIRHENLWYCPTRYVPGLAIRGESIAQRRRRGADLARLHLALRGLDERMGQRPGWRPQHTAVTAHAGIDWDACVSGLAEVAPRLGAWACSAADQVRAGMAAVGACELPVMVVHGDFAEWNVHYSGGRLAGVIDFGLTHLDSRPYELAIARTYRAPQVIDAYRTELVRRGWPLSNLEEAAIEPVYRAFRVDMVGWLMEHSRSTGDYDLAVIERQLARTRTPPP